MSGLYESLASPTTTMPGGGPLPCVTSVSGPADPTSGFAASAGAFAATTSAMATNPIPRTASVAFWNVVNIWTSFFLAAEDVRDAGPVPYDRPMRIVVVADTHIPYHAVALPLALRRALRLADLILHAGDVTSASLLEELEQFAPGRAALGNNDRASVRRRGARATQRL